MLLEILDLRKKTQSDSIITSPNYRLSEYQLELLFACPLERFVCKCLKFSRGYGTISLLETCNEGYLKETLSQGGLEFTGISDSI